MTISIVIREDLPNMLKVAFTQRPIKICRIILDYDVLGIDVDKNNVWVNTSDSKVASLVDFLDKNVGLFLSYTENDLAFIVARGIGWDIRIINMENHKDVVCVLDIDYGLATDENGQLKQCITEIDMKYS
jgi:hypothetical protein